MISGYINVNLKRYMYKNLRIYKKAHLIKMSFLDIKQFKKNYYAVTALLDEPAFDPTSDSTVDVAASDAGTVAT